MAVAVAVAVVVAATTTMRTTATTRRHDDEHNDDSNDDNVCACANLGNKCHTAIPLPNNLSYQKYHRHDRNPSVRVKVS